MQIVRTLKLPLAIEDDAQRRALRFDRIPFALSDGEETLQPRSHH